MAQIELAVLALGATDIHLLQTGPMRARSVRPGPELTHMVGELDDPFNPLRPRRVRMPGRLALVDGEDDATLLALVPPSGFDGLDPFTLADAWHAVREPSAIRALFRELLDVVALEGGRPMRPSATALVVVLPLAMPLAVRGALREVLAEAGYRWTALCYPPEASAAWRGIPMLAEAGLVDLAAPIAGADGPARVPARVELDDGRARIALGHAAARDVADDAPAFEWEASVGDVLRGGLLLAALRTLAGVEVAVERRWHFAMSADGQTAHRISLVEHSPGRRVGLLGLEIVDPPHDPALVLHAGLDPNLPLPAMARCGAMRIGKFRIADNANTVVGQVEWIDGEGVRWGWRLTTTGEADSVALPRELFI